MCWLRGQLKTRYMSEEVILVRMNMYVWTSRVYIVHICTCTVQVEYEYSRHNIGFRQNTRTRYTVLVYRLKQTCLKANRINGYCEHCSI